jgi:ribosomal protein S18 acetylase RimI-like enzyme
LNLYALGDLDDFFWPRTTWYGLNPFEGLSPIALQYAADACPTLLALARRPGRMQQLVHSIVPLLPDTVHAHLTSGVVDALQPDYRIGRRKRMVRMMLRGKTQGEIPAAGVRRLNGQDLPELRRLYAESYEDNWFEERMLATGMYFGITADSRLVSVAGVHVYSPRYGVAALGNIATHPDYRGNGYGSAVTAELCRHLRATVEFIGLNAATTNAAAIRVYRKLGFERVFDYEELLLRRGRQSGQ